MRFEMKNLRELQHFLGLEVSKCKEGIFVSQRSYTKRILDEFQVRLQINVHPYRAELEVEVC